LTVRCRAGAHVEEVYRVAFWVPALRSNACALQRVRDTGTHPRNPTGKLTSH